MKPRYKDDWRKKENPSRTEIPYLKLALLLILLLFIFREASKMYGLNASRSEKVEAFRGEYVIGTKGTLTPEEATKNIALPPRLYAREVITFTAEHDLIHRGINRFLPQFYLDSQGKKRSLSFELEEVFNKAGVIEGATLERSLIRLYDPKGEALLPKGLNQTGVSYFMNAEAPTESITFDLIPAALTDFTDIRLQFSPISGGKIEIVSSDETVKEAIELQIKENAGVVKVQRLGIGEKLRVTLGK